MIGDADILSGLPGEALIREGLIDRAEGRRTIAACLVELAAPRLVKARLLAPPAAGATLDTELFLYRLLQDLGRKAFSSYTSLLRELTSFERALDHRIRKCEGRPRLPS